MMLAPLPPNETARVDALRAFGILDTPPEVEYDDLVRLAATICGTPMAAITLIDPDRQWFKAKVGIDRSETSRDAAFCAHAIQQYDVFVVPDATADERFKNNPCVTDAPHVRFYAGMPLTTPEGHNVGALCVVDHTPRPLTHEQHDALRILGKQVMAQMLLRRQVEQLRQLSLERETALATAQANETKYRSVVGRLAEGVMLVDVATRRFVEINEAMLRLLGYTRAELLALEPFEIVAKESREMFIQHVAEMDATLNQTGRCDLGRRFLRCKDGTGITAEIRVTVVPNDGVGEGAGYHAVIVRDVTEQLQYEERLFEYQLDLEQANAKLRALATMDSLTGINNRAALNDRLLEAFERARRYSRPLSVVMLDVDHFKPFNDTFGHPAGDDVLRDLAKILIDSIRSADIVARYGGEEFVLLLPDTEYAGAMVLAERCRRAIAGHTWDKRTITVSIGVSTLTDAMHQPSCILLDADEALYRSKLAGRNRVTHSNATLLPFVAVPG